MSLLHPDDRLDDRPDALRRAGLLWAAVGLVGSLITAVAATGAGALPVDDSLGTWPELLSLRSVPAVVLAYTGITLLCGAWWQLGPIVRRLPDRLPFVLRTAAAWAAPLAIAPPLYSRDVYSYLVQGALFGAGWDPYRYGPSAYGGGMAENVSAVWQDTPAPYGPVFLGTASGVTSISGEHLVVGILLMRVVMIGALVATTACLIPLARRFGVDPAAGIWLAILNPLTLGHLVSGAHNDALMILFMVAGLLLATRGRPLLAAAVIGLALLVKLPAAAALVVVVPAMARRLEGRYRMQRAALMVGGVALVSVVAVTELTGTGFGWLAALSDTAKVRNGLSMSTNAGLLVNGLAWLVGGHPWALDAVAVMRALGVGAAAVIVLVTLARHRGRPVYALAVIMFAVVLLGPVVHPWYLLWGVVPVAVSSRDPRIVRLVGLLTVVLVYHSLPWGGTVGTDVLLGVLGAVLGVAVLHLVRLGQVAQEGRDDEAAALQLQAR